MQKYIYFLIYYLFCVVFLKYLVQGTIIYGENW